MRQSCPAGSTLPLFRPTAFSSHQAPNKVPPVPAPSTCFISKEQTDCLSGLYQISKNRNHRLLQLSLNLSRDINFLKEYCKYLQMQLQRKGFYQQKRIQKLSRKQTAASIFNSYSDTSSLIQDCRSEEEAEVQLSRLRSRNSSLEHQNKQLHSKVNHDLVFRMHKAVQVDNSEFQSLRHEYKQAQDKIGKLNTEVSKLRQVNGVLQLEQRRRQVQSGILQASKQVFGKIHEVMRDYRRRMNVLAHQKKDIQRKYCQLRENIRLTEGGCQLKLIDLLNQKVSILERLVQKQQVELQSTITVYQTQLSKIQERRREELQFFENERLGLENENIKLCIDVQKALNRQDSANLLLMQQKNTNQRLTKEVVQLTHNINSFEVKQKRIKAQKLTLESGVFKFYGQNFRANSQKGSEANRSYHSAWYQYGENENSINFSSQFSENSEGSPYKRPINMHRKTQEREDDNYKGLESIKITYNSYLGPGVKMHGTYGRYHDSAVQFKRRLVESKPDTISNKR